MAERNADRTVDQELSAIKGDLGQLRQDMAALTRALADSAEGGARDVADKVRDMAAKTQDGAERLSRAALAQGEQSFHAIATQIEQRPFTSILAAFGVGLVIGRLLDRH